ncbi:hypothetical protein FFE93_008065 [Yersinia sp. KBS0713]|nr:hypothetical protein FFE93_008065 [Yersinia sp. KBS0713]
MGGSYRYWCSVIQNSNVWTILENNHASVLIIYLDSKILRPVLMRVFSYNQAHRGLIRKL